MEKGGDSFNDCPYGCQCGRMSAADLTDHMQSQLATHLESLRQRICDACLALPQAGRSNQVALEQLADMELRIKRLTEDLRRSGVARGVPRAAGGGVTSDGEVRDATGEGSRGGVDAIMQRINIDECILIIINRELPELCTLVDTVEQSQQADGVLLEGLNQKLTSLEHMLGVKLTAVPDQRVTPLDQRMTSLDLRVTSLEQTSYSGTLVWRIDKVRQRREEALSGQRAFFDSPVFHTSKTGYKMCARIYLSGSGAGKGTHVSLYFVVMRGDYDTMLSWPFRQKVTLLLRDQNNRGDASDAFRPDPASSSFQRPTEAMNVASGCPQFLPLSQMFGNECAYVKDDVAFVKVVVSLDGLE